MSPDVHIVCATEAATAALAARLAKTLRAPCAILLRGGLGAGKTSFVRGFVAALDPGVRVKSPTYALAHSYPTAPVVHHLDLYRMSESEDAFELGLEHLLTDDDAFALVEWPDVVAAALKAHPQVIDVSLSEPGVMAGGGDVELGGPRTITLRGLPAALHQALAQETTRPDMNS